MSDSRWVEVGAPKSTTQFPGYQPLTELFQAVGAGSEGEAREGAAGRGRRGRDQISGRDRRRRKRGEKRKEGSAGRSRRLPEREQAHVAFGAPPDSARGLFIEILAVCELVKQLKWKEISDERVKAKKKKAMIPLYLI